MYFSLIFSTIVEKYYAQQPELSEGVSACGKVKLGEGLKELLPLESSGCWEEGVDFFPTSVRLKTLHPN